MSNRSKPIIPPPVWGLLCALGMKACQVWLPGLGFSCPGPHHRQVCALFVLTGLTIACLGLATFKEAKTTPNPMNPNLASHLVTHGIYRFSRNPMYLGVLLILTGWCLFLQNLLGFVFLPIFLLVITEFQIRPEEEALNEIFGQDYLAYCHQTPRWLIGGRPPFSSTSSSTASPPQT